MHCEFLRWIRGVYLQIEKDKRITNVHKHIKFFDTIFYLYTHKKKLTTIETGILKIFFFRFVLGTADVFECTHLCIHTSETPYGYKNTHIYTLFTLNFIPHTKCFVLNFTHSMCFILIEIRGSDFHIYEHPTNLDELKC